MITEMCGGHANESQILHAELLSHIQRYEGEPMIHRTDVLMHTQRVVHLAIFLNNIYNKALGQPLTKDSDWVRELAYIHDDHEIVTSDIPSPLKLAMSKDELQKLINDEQIADIYISKLVHGLSNPQEYGMYLTEQAEIRAKKTPHAQIVDIADKWDALGEKLHEVRCGNERFSEFLENSYNQFRKFQSTYESFRIINKEFKNNWDSHLLVMPPKEKILQLPKLRPEDLTTQDEAVNQMMKSFYGSWPFSYEIWAELSCETFKYNFVENVFPGWKNQLWQQWGQYPKKIFASDLIIPTGTDVHSIEPFNTPTPLETYLETINEILEEE